jgi:uncharacterized protein YeaO (DUF488 family)
MKVLIRRVYEERAVSDGTRVLVDRLWPRGMTKARADVDAWCRDIAPSTELRTWYRGQPDRFEEFGTAIRPSWPGRSRRRRRHICVRWQHAGR